MPKIEIETKDFFALENEKQILKEQNANLLSEVRELEDKIKSFNESEIEQKAITLSKKLFVQYMKATFSKLGFEHNEINFNNVSHWLGKEWWENDRLEVELNPAITQKWASIVLNFNTMKNAKKIESNLLNILKESTNA